MKRFLISLAAVCTLLFVMPGHSQMGRMGMMGGGGMMSGSLIRHRFVMHNGIDPKYANKVNPLRPTAVNVEQGKKLYESNCAACHGPSGRGNGPAAQSLNPPPPDIADSSKTPMVTDGYLYWTIADGGVPLGTAMPAFKTTLKADEIWKIILYVREL